MYTYIYSFYVNIEGQRDILIKNNCCLLDNLIFHVECKQTKCTIYIYVYICICMYVHMIARMYVYVLYIYCCTYICKHKAVLLVHTCMIIHIYISLSIYILTYEHKHLPG